jgi:hypothetical protein
MLDTNVAKVPTFIYKKITKSISLALGRTGMGKTVTENSGIFVVF